jgi:tRNA pseudouridine55 synthase
MVGAATRLARFLAEGQKGYDAGMRLGVETDSGDRTGTVVAQAPPGRPWPSLPAVCDALLGLGGTRDQVPPAFSAKWVDGSRAYTLARAGADVAVRPASVTLHEARVTAYDPPRLRLAIRCSAGFYVRALARDLGRLLDCGAFLEDLRRTGSADMTLARAVSLDLLVEEPGEAARRMVPLEDLLPHLPAARLAETGERKARHGNDLAAGDCVEPAPALPPGTHVRLFSREGRLVAIATAAGPGGVLHPAVVLQ